MKCIVLMYHDIYRDSTTESGFQNPTAIKYKVRADRFEAQVAAIDSYLRKRKLPASSIDFTFDDGGISFLTVAAPILEKYGFRGIFFVSTGYIGANGFLDVNQIKELQHRGHLIGNHSHSHPERMSVMTTQELNDEWYTSQMILTEVLGHKPKVASIPNGYSSAKVLDAMVDADLTIIDTSATTTYQSHHKDAIIRGRYVITDDMTTDQVIRIISSPVYRIKKAIKWSVLNCAKAILGNSYLKIRAKLS